MPDLHHGGESRASGGYMCPQSGGKDRQTLVLTWLPPFIQSERLVHRIGPSTFRLSYFSSVNPLWKQPHMYAQGCVFWMILNSAKLPAAHLTFLLEYLHYGFHERTSHRPGIPNPWGSHCHLGFIFTASGKGSLGHP